MYVAAIVYKKWKGLGYHIMNTVKVFKEYFYFLRIKISKTNLCFSRRAGFLVEKSVKLLILFCLKSKIDKKLYDVIPLSIVVIIKE